MKCQLHFSICFKTWVVLLSSFAFILLRWCLSLTAVVPLTNLSFHCDGSSQSGAANEDDAVSDAARRRKNRTCPEFIAPLTVFILGLPFYFYKKSVCDLFTVMLFRIVSSTLSVVTRFESCPWLLTSFSPHQSLEFFFLNKYWMSFIILRMIENFTFVLSIWYLLQKRAFVNCIIFDFENLIGNIVFGQDKSISSIIQFAVQFFHFQWNTRIKMMQTVKKIPINKLEKKSQKMTTITKTSLNVDVFFKNRSWFVFKNEWSAKFYFIAKFLWFINLTILAFLNYDNIGKLKTISIWSTMKLSIQSLHLSSFQMVPSSGNIDRMLLVIWWSLYSANQENDTMTVFL